MPTALTNDIDTYYERHGSGPPVVFVHGAILDHTQWAMQVEALSDHYAAIAYDVRGHGLTGGSQVKPYTIGLLADDLEAFIAALDIDPPVVCGLSTGGCIAQMYAARPSNAVSGLVLADTFAPAIHSVWEWLQRSVLLRATIPPVRLVGYQRVERAMVWLQERIQGRRVSGDYTRIEEVRAGAPTMATTEFAKVIRAVASFDEEVIDLASIAVPTLVLYGEHEPGFIRRHASRLGDTIPNTVVREVPNAGHASNLDNPGFFTAALRAFFADVWPDQASDASDDSRIDSSSG